MGPMPSSRIVAVDAPAKALLKDIAHRTIHHGLGRGERLEIDLSACPASVLAAGAAFVTLKLGGDLRGCLGSLEPRRPLAQDVADNAYAAAFQDPRFAPLSAREYPRTTVSIALLSAPEALACPSEEALVAALQPGVDGLILEEGTVFRATFLPAVWESIDRPDEFVRRLKMKAGLPAHYWSATLRVKRYTTELIT